MDVKNLCVFCGAHEGYKIEYGELAFDLGQKMVGHGMQLVYGAGGSGLMGAVANGVLSAGGTGIGITIPQLINVEKPIAGFPFEEASDINERKRRMMELADAFCVLPGGMGTMDEISDYLVKQQIGVMKKPMIFLNYNHYWNYLSLWIDRAIEEGFIQSRAEYIIGTVDTVDQVFEALRNDF